LLSKNQKSFTFTTPDSDIEADIHVSSFAANDPIEDAWCVKSISVAGPEEDRQAVLGVFDGMYRRSKIGQALANGTTRITNNLKKRGKLQNEHQVHKCYERTIR
jgi:hypothetical protein